MVALSLLQLASAIGALEFVVPGIRVAYAYLRFQVPMLAEHPRVAVSGSGTGEPALVSVLPQRGEVGTGELEPRVDIACVILPSVQMESQKMASHLPAEPVTQSQCFHFLLSEKVHGL